MGTEVSKLTATEFVTARLDEEEAVARIASPGPWFVDQVGDFGDKGATLEIARWRGHLNTVNLGEDFLTAEHIARHDPARVLAQCAAMRKIVEGHSGSHVCEDSLVGERWHDPFAADFIEDDPCWNLRALTSIWSDHPQFDPAWA